MTRHPSGGTREKRRLIRQFEMLERRIPALRNPIRLLLRDRWTLVRLPLAILMIAGGLLSVLPFLGLWMLPLGVLLLAVDVPFLRPSASAFVIRGRRWSMERLRQLRVRRT